MTIIYKIMLLCLVFEGKEKRWHVFGEGKYLVFLVGKNEKGRGTFSEKRIFLEDVEDLEKNLRIIGNEKQEYFGEGIYLDPRGKEGTRMKLNIFCPRKYSLNRWLSHVHQRAIKQTCLFLHSKIFTKRDEDRERRGEKNLQNGKLMRTKPTGIEVEHKRFLQTPKR